MATQKYEKSFMGRYQDTEWRCYDIEPTERNSKKLSDKDKELVSKEFGSLDLIESSGVPDILMVSDKETKFVEIKQGSSTRMSIYQFEWLTNWDADVYLVHYDSLDDKINFAFEINASKFEEKDGILD